MRSPRRVKVAGVRSSSAAPGRHVAPSAPGAEIHDGTERGGSRSVTRQGVRMHESGSSFLTTTVGLLDRALLDRDLLVLEEGVEAWGGATRLVSSVRAAGAVYLELGRRWRLPSPSASSLEPRVGSQAGSAGPAAPPHVGAGATLGGAAVRGEMSRAASLVGVALRRDRAVPEVDATVPVASRRWARSGVGEGERKRLGSFLDRGSLRRGAGACDAAAASVPKGADGVMSLRATRGVRVAGVSGAPVAVVADEARSGVR